MGKQGSARSLETQQSGDASIGRRMLGADYNWNKPALLHGLKNEPSKFSARKGVYVGKRHLWFRKHVRSMVLSIVLMGFLFLLDSLVFSVFYPTSGSTPRKSIRRKEERTAYVNEEKIPVQMYDRLLNLASNALAEKEFHQDSPKFWEEQFPQTTMWRPCADTKTPKTPGSRRRAPVIYWSALMVV